jgi:hypothetical protein
MLTCRTILLSYIRMYHGLKAQGISRDSFPYKAPLQPYLSYFGVSFTLLVAIPASDTDATVLLVHRHHPPERFPRIPARQLGHQQVYRSLHQYVYTSLPL